MSLASGSTFVHFPQALFDAWMARAFSRCVLDEYETDFREMRNVCGRKVVSKPPVHCFCLIVRSAKAASPAVSGDSDQPVKKAYRFVVSSVFHKRRSERRVIPAGGSHWEAHVGNHNNSGAWRCATNVLRWRIRGRRSINKGSNRLVCAFLESNLKRRAVLLSACCRSGTDRRIASKSCALRCRM